MAIDAAIGQPRLGRRHGAVGHLGPLPPGILAYRKVAIAGPGQVERPAAGLARIGQVGERGQHGPRLDCAAGHQLRQRQKFHLRVIGVQRRVGQNAIGRAQIETEDKLRGVASEFVLMSTPLPQAR